MRIGCDVGGTFTDLVARDVDGTVRLGKALNSGTGPSAGLIDALSAAGSKPEDAIELSHGTTTVTNLLIERTGAPVGVICTRGFRDVLELQYSFRRLTFAARYEKEPALVPRHRRLEIGGRIDREGREVEPLDQDEVADACRRLLDDGVEALAVSLYNAYANPAHEQAVAEVWRSLAPELPVTCATDVDPGIGEYERVSTATLNATAVPRMRAYADEVRNTLSAPTFYMHSGGGVVGPDDAAERPIQLAFSGPAAGVLAARNVADELRLVDAITLDMGGTSCDVCLIRGGEVRERESFEVAFGIPARIRSIDINTVGAGGGSIAYQDAGGALRVGPRSAGALPGPACYGRGGIEPTVTDANLALGILGKSGLLGGRLTLDAVAANAALETVAASFDVDATELARGIHRTVNANMAQAVREVTVRQGIDPRTCALIAFGGAGPQHATGVAKELDVRTVVIPAHSSVLSAMGLLTADVRVSASRVLLQPVDSLADAATEEMFAALEADCKLRLKGVKAAMFAVERWVGLRYADQWHQVALPLTEDLTSLAEDFEAEHERRFGTRLGDPVEVVDCWVNVVGQREEAAIGCAPASVSVAPSARGTFLFDADAQVLSRAHLAQHSVDGPALIEEETTVTVIPPGSRATLKNHHIVVESGIA